MSNKVAVLIDTVSIQQYIFSSNKLKENVGASNIVKNIFKKELGNSLSNIPYTEIGYEGGGNALILFNHKNDAVNFIKNYSKNLLKKYPSLKTSFAIEENFKTEGVEYQNSIKNLHKKLQRNKNIYFPEVVLQKHGITAECPLSGYSAEVKYEEDFISLVSKSKMDASNWNDELNQFLENHPDYIFTLEIEKLWQPSEKSYICVVHIDGNSIGKRIQNIKSLKDMKIFSKKLVEITNNAFQKMLDTMIDKIENNSDYFSEENGFKQEYKNDKKILPFRPIIIGGDDITFVSHGKLGIWLSEIFIKEFEKGVLPDGKNLTACAGISIVKTKYPFYRSYLWAEELTSNAKKKYKEKEGSYLDFFVSSSGFTGSIEEIREKNFKSREGENLYMNGYSIESLETLKNLAKKLTEFPKNKIMKLREMYFYSSREKIEAFKKEIESLTGKKLPSELNEKNFIEALELMEFYPFELGEVLS